MEQQEQLEQLTAIGGSTKSALLRLAEGLCVSQSRYQRFLMSLYGKRFHECAACVFSMIEGFLKSVCFRQKDTLLANILVRFALPKGLQNSLLVAKIKRFRKINFKCH